MRGQNQAPALLSRAESPITTEWEAERVAEPALRLEELITAFAGHRATISLIFNS
jgi:hypothetical protein